MADPKILIRRSSTPNKVPDTTHLQLGELAINTFDGKLYLEKDQTGSSGIATVIVVNPWSVGLGSLAYDTFFTAGNVGIGTELPSQLLDVNGDIRLRGAIYDSLNNVGSVNQILVSNAGAGVTWTDITGIPVGDANTLDGLDSTQFLRSDVADTKAGITTFSDEVILQSNLNVTGVSTFQSDIHLGDNQKIYIGDGNDLQLFHDGLNSYVRDSGTGALSLVSGTAVNIIKTGGDKLAVFTPDNSVELYYANSKKFETTGAGVTVTGIATAATFYAQGGTYAAAVDTKTDAALVLEGENSIYVAETGGDYIRNLIGRVSNNIIIGQQATNYIQGIDLKPGASNAKVRLHAGGSGDNVKLETTGYGVTVTGGAYISGVTTASSFVKEGGTSSQFLKADGSVDSNTYLTAEAQSLDGVLGLGNTSSLGMSVGIVTATAFVGDGSGLLNVPANIGISTNIANQSQFLTYAVSTGSTTGLGVTNGLVFNPSNGRLGIGSLTPAFTLDVAGDINSSTDVKINGTGVLDTALALAIALG